MSAKEFFYDRFPGMEKDIFSAQTMVDFAAEYAAEKIYETIEFAKWSNDMGFIYMRLSDKWFDENSDEEERQKLTTHDLWNEFKSSKSSNSSKNNNTLALGAVSNSLVADIKNKLAPIKILCKMIQDRDVEPFMADDPRNEIVDKELEIVFKNIEYLSNL